MSAWSAPAWSAALPLWRWRKRDFALPWWKRTNPSPGASKMPICASMRSRRTTVNSSMSWAYGTALPRRVRNRIGRCVCGMPPAAASCTSAPSRSAGKRSATSSNTACWSIACGRRSRVSPASFATVRTNWRRSSRTTSPRRSRWSAVRDYAPRWSSARMALHRKYATPLIWTVGSASALTGRSRRAATVSSMAARVAARSARLTEAAMAKVP